MAKVTLARKKELNEPDEFITLSNKALVYARQNKTSITAVIAGAVALVVLIAGFQFYSQNRETRAFTRYAADMEWYETVSKDTAGAVSLKEIKEKGDSFLSDFSGTAAAMLARAKYAGIYFEEKDYTSAARLYEDLLSAIRHDVALRNITLCALAQCYEAMDKRDIALARYQDILSGNNAIKKDEALFHLALMYSKNGELSKTQEAYARIANEFKDSMYAEIARENMNG